MRGGAVVDGVLDRRPDADAHGRERRAHDQVAVPEDEGRRRAPAPPARAQSNTLSSKRAKYIHHSTAASAKPMLAVAAALTAHEESAVRARSA